MCSQVARGHFPLYSSSRNARGDCALLAVNLLATTTETICAETPSENAHFQKPLRCRRIGRTWILMIGPRRGLCVCTSACTFMCVCVCVYVCVYICPVCDLWYAYASLRSTLRRHTPFLESCFSFELLRSVFGPIAPVLKRFVW